MPSQDIRSILKLETDSAGVRSAQAALNKILDQQAQLKAAFQKGEIGVKDYAQQMGKLEREANDNAKAIRSVTDALEDQNKVVARSKLALEQRQEAFDKASQGVALAGDVESGLRTIGGAAGAIGAAPVAGALGGAGEFFATIEALPRLKAAAAGLPQVIDSAAAAFGTTGIGLIGAMGIAALAVVALQAAFTAFIQSAEKQANELTAVIEARRGVGQAVAGGLGTEEAGARIEEINRLRAEEQKLLDDTSQALKDAIAGQDLYGAAAIASTPQFQALQEQVTQSEATIASYTEEERALQAARDSGELTTNDAAIAEEKLAAERSAAVLSQAQAAGDLVRAQQEAANLTRAEASTRVEGLKQQTAALQAQLSVLKSSGDTSEAVASQIKQLENQIGSLGKQAEVFNKVAQSSSATKKELEQAATAQNKAASAASKGAKSFDQLGKSLDGGVKKAEDYRQKLADLEKKFNEDEFKLRQDTANKRIDEEINLGRELAKTQRDYLNNYSDSLAEGNFLAVRQLNKDTIRTKAEQRIQSNENQQDITRDAQRAHQEMMRQRAGQERELMAQQQQFHQRTISAASAWGNAMTSVFAQFWANTRRLSTGGSSTLRNAPRGA